MRRAFLIAVLASAGCSPWQFPEKPPRYGPATALGTQLPTEGGVLRSASLLVGASSTRAVAMVQEGTGLDSELRPTSEVKTQWYSVDASGVARPLPPPPANIERFWPMQPLDALLAQAGNQIYVLTPDDAWTPVAQQPLFTPPFHFLTRLADGRTFARSGARAAVLVDGTWRELSAALGLMPTDRLIFGPASADAVRLVWLAGTSVCTQLVDTRTTFAPTGPRTCKPNRELPAPQWLGEAFNGTVDDFQVFFGLTDHGIAWRFKDGAWLRGYLFDGRSVVTVPGSTDAFISTSGEQLAGAVYRLSAGQGAGVAYEPPWNLFRGCLPPLCNPRGSAFAWASDLSGAWYLQANEADARRTVFIKHGVMEAPPTCTPACAANQRCVTAAEGVTACAVDGSRTGVSTATPTTLRLQFASVRGPAYPVVALTNLATGETTTPPSSLENLAEILEVPPLARVRLSATYADAAPFSLELTTPDEGVQADLGSFVFTGGTIVGPVATSQVPAFTADALYVPSTERDGGAALRRVQDASDGGLAVTAAFPVSANTTVIGSPDDRWLFLGTGTQLELVDLQTSARATVGGSTRAEPWGAPHVSRDGTRAAVERLSGVSVISLTTAGPTELFEAHGLNASNPASFLQLSKDGSALLVRTISGWSVVTAQGSFPVPGTPTDVVLSGDGSRAYLATATGTGASSLSVWPVGSTAAPVSLGVDASAYAVDLDSADLLFTTTTSPNHEQVSRYVAASGTVVPVTARLGRAGAYPRSGALWVDPGGGSWALFFPASLPMPRAMSGLAPTTLGGALDARGRIQVKSTTATTVITEVSEQVLARGPGVFRPDHSRRLTQASGALTVEALNGTAIGAPTTVAFSAFTVAPVFTREVPMNTLGAPCALFTVPTRTPTIEPLTGAVTWTAGPDELRCVK